MRSIFRGSSLFAFFFVAGCNALLGIDSPSGDSGVAPAEDGGPGHPGGDLSDAPSSSNPGADGSGGGGDSSSSSAAEASVPPPVEAGWGSEAGPAPDAPAASEAGAACASGVDLSTDSDNCGRCGHTCAGAGCFDGQCSPFMVQGQQDYSTTLAADGSGIYWGSDGYSELLACPISGCAAAPTVVTGTQGIPWYIALGGGSVFWSNQATTSSTIFWAPEASLGPAGQTFVARSAAVSCLVADGADVLWTEYINGVWTTYECPASGCTSPTPLFADPVVNMAGDGTNLVWSSAQTALKTCTKSQCVQQELLSSGLTNARHVALHDGVAYIVDTGGANLGTGSISACPLHSQSCTAGSFLAGLPAPSFIAVDDSGVYWAAAEGLDASDTSASLYTCPLAGCPSSGPTVVVSGQQGIASITLYGNLIYWITGTYGQSIMAVAKP